MQGLAKTLVIDDDPQHRHDLSVILNFVGEQHEAISTDEAEGALWEQPWGACLIGNIHSVKKQNQVLEQLRQRYHIPVLSMPQHEKAVSGMPNFVGTLAHPLHYSQLMDALRHCQEFQGKHHFQVPQLSRKNTLFRSMVGRSDSISQVRYLIEQVAGTDASVLILGESGTGKEVVARNIHYHSSRGKGPFVPVNCGAIPAELLESELFGHEKGAFTGAISSRKGRFELAEGGTLFLDEIGDMPMPMQVKLLRVIQERCFERVGGNQSIKANVRIIAATHRNLDTMIAENLFREDLFYRLNVFPIETPPLRERLEDIPLLLQELLSRMEAEGARSVHFTPRAITSLMEHDWPGNVRELANLVERLMILYPGEMVDVNHLPVKYRYCDLPDFRPEERMMSVEEQERAMLADVFSDSYDDQDDNFGFSDLPPEGLNLKEMLADLEIDMIRQALEAQAGVVARAADMLGMRRTTLVEKMRKYNISTKESVREESVRE
ncbi:MAG: sigma-54 dependent transcriptional regulator [Photobacterium halotolerans]